MILCIMILIAGIILLVQGVIALYKTRNTFDFSILGIFAFATGLVTIIVATVLLFVIPIESQKELNIFITQKEYIENYEPTSEYDAAGIANKKIELNEWLYGVQYTKEHYPICSFYGDDILELEPIK